MYFQSMAGRTWCILISLNCCRSDVSQATGGLADGCSHIEKSVVSEGSSVDSLPSCRSLASHGISSRA